MAPVRWKIPYSIQKGEEQFIIPIGELLYIDPLKSEVTIKTRNTVRKSNIYGQWKCVPSTLAISSRSQVLSSSDIANVDYEEAVESFTDIFGCSSFFSSFFSSIKGSLFSFDTFESSDICNFDLVFLTFANSSFSFLYVTHPYSKDLYPIYNSTNVSKIKIIDGGNA